MKKTILISIFLTIIILAGLLVIKQNNIADNRKFVNKVIPTTSPNTNQEQPVPTRIEYKKLLTYGVEINQEQYELFVKAYQINKISSEAPSSYFAKEEWYFIDGPMQTQQLYIRYPYVCETWFLWCGSLNMNDPDQVRDERNRCQTYDYDHSDPTSWIGSNTGQCCHGLINNTSHILSCAQTNIGSDERLKEELDYTYELLKSINASCDKYNCPPALETEILYY